MFKLIFDFKHYLNNSIICWICFLFRAWYLAIGGVFLGPFPGPPVISQPPIQVAMSWIHIRFLNKNFKRKIITKKSLTQLDYIIQVLTILAWPILQNVIDNSMKVKYLSIQLFGGAYFFRSRLGEGRSCKHSKIIPVVSLRRKSSAFWARQMFNSCKNNYRIHYHRLLTCCHEIICSFNKAEFFFNLEKTFILHWSK